MPILESSGQENRHSLNNWNNLLEDFDCPLLASIWEGRNMQRILTLQRQEGSNARRFLMCGENQRWEGALLLRHKNKNPQGWAFIPLCDLKLPLKLTEPEALLFPLSFYLYIPFLSFKTLLSSSHFLTSSSPYRSQPQPQVWPSLVMGVKLPSSVGSLSLHIWLPLG